MIALVACQHKNCETTQLKPICSGESWYDTDGNIINAHGGGMLYYDGTYYWFGEYKSDSTSAALHGVGCYSSSNLVDWDYKGIALAVSQDWRSDIASGCTLERPKVIYNSRSQQFVMFFHLELVGTGYSSARVGIAVSSNVTGPYEYLYSYRPNAGILPMNLTENPDFDIDMSHYEWWTPEWTEAMTKGMIAYRDLEGGQMSRDMTLYVDDDGKAYHIYSAEENLTLNIAELTDDYLGHTGRYRRVLPGGHNEAPAIFKKDGKYYMITSGCTGWDPNAARLSVADSMMGEWTYLGNPCRGADSALTYHSQSTYIQPIIGKKDAFLFMADRWNPECHTKGTYIWLPIQFEADGTPYLEWMDSWDLSYFK